MTSCKKVVGLYSTIKNSYSERIRSGGCFILAFQEGTLHLQPLHFKYVYICFLKSTVSDSVLLFCKLKAREVVSERFKFLIGGTWRRMLSFRSLVLTFFVLLVAAKFQVTVAVSKIPLQKVEVSAKFHCQTYRCTRCKSKGDSISNGCQSGKKVFFATRDKCKKKKYCKCKIQCKGWDEYKMLKDNS